MKKILIAGVVAYILILFATALEKNIDNPEFCKNSGTYERVAMRSREKL